MNWNEIDSNNAADNVMTYKYVVRNAQKYGKQLLSCQNQFLMIMEQECMSIKAMEKRSTTIFGSYANLSQTARWYIYVF